MSDREVQGLLIQIEATTAQLRREMASADDLVARTTRQIDRNLGTVDQAFDRAGQGAQQAGSLIRGTFAAIAGAGLVGGIIKQVDAVGQMNDRMKELTGASGEYDKVQARLLATAKQTYRPLQEAQELYLLTADSIKSMGFDTQQTLDITDSFSYLLVTNAASADRGRSALDAYSKSLMQNRVGADEWRSIMAAMPTVVGALSTATGKSAEEIKRLGVEGKLSVEDLNRAFLKTVETNRAAAERMRASVTDALVNINTALGVYLGRAEDSTGAAGALADALGTVADNIDVVAAVVGGVAAGAMAAYTAKAALATAETVRGIRVAMADRAARIAQAEALLQAAIAEQRKAQSAVILAAREAQAARGTAVQTQLSIQLAQARQREASATAAVATAQAGLRTASAGLGALLGGPMGLALMAGTAAASFLLFSEHSKKVEQSLVDLGQPLDTVIAKFKELAKDQQAGELVRVTREQEQAVRDQAAAYDELLSSVRQDLGSTVFARIKGDIDAAYESGRPLSEVIEELSRRFRIPEESLRTWLDQAGRIKTASLESAHLADVISRLTAETESNTGATHANNAAKSGMSEAGNKYLGTLQKQLAGLQDNGDAIKTANRYITEHADLTEADRVAILSAANAIEQQKKANQARTASTKASTKALKDERTAIDAVIDRALPEKKRLSDLAEGIEHLRQAQKSGRLSTADMEQGIKNLNEAYAAGSLQKQLQEEQKLTEARRRGAEAYREAMEVVLQSRQQAIDTDVAGVGLGDQEREQLDRLNSVRARYADMRRALEEQQEDASRRLSKAAYEQRLADLAEYQAREIQMEVDGVEAKLAAQRDWSNGARRAFQNLQYEANDFASATDRALTGAFNSSKDAFADFVTTGKTDFRSLANSIIADMARIAAQQAASGLMSGLFSMGVSAVGSYFGGGSTAAGATQAGYTGTDFSNWAAAQADGGAWAGGTQFFAKGGAFTNAVVNRPTAFGMAGGRQGVMGEAGPEAIVPLARAADGSLGVRSLGGVEAAGGTSIQLNAPVSLNVQDRSAEGMELDQDALGRNMQAEIQKAADAAVAKSWRPGGVSYRQMQGRG